MIMVGQNLSMFYGVTKCMAEEPLARYHRGETGGRLNIKMSSHQNRDPHVKDKTVSWPSYL